MISTKSMVEILNEAADIIERDGWVSHIRHSVGGQVCAIGALERAATGISYQRYYTDGYYGKAAEQSCPAAMAALADMVKARFPERPIPVMHNGATIASWSNSHTEADGAKKVACLMRAAAIWEEEK